MSILSAPFLLIFLYFSYFFVAKYPFVIANIFGARDVRVKRVLNKIWHLNFTNRAFAVHKMMKRPHNKSYLSFHHPGLIEDYKQARKYWLISLIPIAVLLAYSQIQQAHEMLTDPDGFREKVENAWFMEYFDDGK